MRGRRNAPSLPMSNPDSVDAARSYLKRSASLRRRSGFAINRGFRGLEKNLLLYIRVIRVIRGSKIFKRSAPLRRGSYNSRDPHLPSCFVK